jgi:hypothetical protein
MLREELGAKRALAGRHALRIEVARSLGGLGGLLGEQDIGVGAVWRIKKSLAGQLDPAPPARVPSLIHDLLGALAFRYRRGWRKRACPLNALEKGVHLIDRGELTGLDQSRQLGRHLLRRAPIRERERRSRLLGPPAGAVFRGL